MKVYQYCNKCRTETVQELTSITKSTVEYICKGVSNHEGSYRIYVPEVKESKNLNNQFTLTRLG